MQIAMIGSKIMPLEEVGPEYLDRGIFFGDGVYEVLRSYNGKIFAFDEHIARFERSLREIEITGVNIDEIRSRVLKAFAQAGITNAKIYFHITRGSGKRDHLPDANTKPNFFLTVQELKDEPKLKSDGVAVSLYPDIRWKRCDIKSLNLLANVLAKRDADRKGCWEAIFVDDNQMITEGSSSSFFAIVGSKLQTSPLDINILPSITRTYVLKAANNIGLEIVEESLTTSQAKAAAELFLGVTTRDIVPAVKFDGQVIGSGRPGKWTKQLIEEFKKFTA
ncbi:MAG: aminotransferase class IV [Sedimentisphaerales bacterium]|nr:aminotransferase class IV [Sedimentisphaerales bacterium]